MGYNVVYIKDGLKQIVRTNLTETQAKEWVEFANEYLKGYSKSSLDRFVLPKSKPAYYDYEKVETHVSKE